MKKTKKKMEDFLFDENEAQYIEKAFYALTDKIKEDRLNKKIDIAEEKQMGKVVEQCMSKLKLHSNYFINKNIYDISLGGEALSKA